MNLLDKINILINKLSYNPIYDEEPDIEIHEIVNVLTVMRNKIYCIKCSNEHNISCTMCSISDRLEQIKYKLDLIKEKHDVLHF